MDLTLEGNFTLDLYLIIMDISSAYNVLASFTWILGADYVTGNNPDRLRSSH